MKTAISIPDHVFRLADQLAVRLGVSRSELYARALDALIAKHQDGLITTRLNEIYGADGAESSLDRDTAYLQQQLLGRVKW